MKRQILVTNLSVWGSFGLGRKKESLSQCCRLDDFDISWYGESVGKWEGDTLVVDSVGFKDSTWLDGVGHPHSEELHVMRISLIVATSRSNQISECDFLGDVRF